MSIALIAAIEVFRVPHLPKERIQIRVGMHTGELHSFYAVDEKKVDFRFDSRGTLLISQAPSCPASSASLCLDTASSETQSTRQRGWSLTENVRDLSMEKKGENFAFFQPVAFTSPPRRIATCHRRLSDGVERRGHGQGSYAQRKLSINDDLFSGNRHDGDFLADRRRGTRLR